MLHARRTALVLALASLPLAARLAPGGQTLVVDDGGGPGVDHTDLQEAVDAAADGALILVHPGTYAGFTVFGKGVLIVAAEDDGVFVATGGISVRQVPVSSHVLLRGLQCAGSDEEGLSILNCAGEVVVEECSFRGALGQGDYDTIPFHPDGYAAIRVEGAAPVLLRCEARGGDGSDYPMPEDSGINGHAAPGLLVRNGSAVVHGGSYAGGEGGDVDYDDANYDGGDGGDAIEVHAALVHVSGAELRGGDGGMGGEEWDGFIGFFSCGDGGDGGSGISEDGGTPALGATALDLEVYPGLGGLGDLGYGACPDGEPGEEFEVAELEVIPEAALGLRIPGPVAEAGTLVLELDGVPGAPVLVGVAGAPDAYALPPLLGPALVSPVGLSVVALGALPASPFTFSFPLGLDLPAGSSLALYAQAVYVAPGSGAIVAGAAAAAIVLDSAL